MYFCDFLIQLCDIILDPIKVEAFKELNRINNEGNWGKRFSQNYFCWSQNKPFWHGRFSTTWSQWSQTWNQNNDTNLPERGQFLVQPNQECWLVVNGKKNQSVNLLYKILSWKNQPPHFIITPYGLTDMSAIFFLLVTIAEILPSFLRATYRYLRFLTKSNNNTLKHIYTDIIKFAIFTIFLSFLKISILSSKKK